MPSKTYMGIPINDTPINETSANDIINPMPIEPPVEYIDPTTVPEDNWDEKIKEQQDKIGFTTGLSQVAPGEAFQAGMLSARKRAVLGYNIMLEEAGLPVDYTEYMELARREQEERADLPDPSQMGFLAKAVQGVAGDIIPGMAEAGIHGGLPGAGAGTIVGGGLGTLAGGVGAVPGAIGGAGTGASIGTTVNFGAQGIGDIYENLMASNVDPSVAGKLAIAASVPYAALERFQLGILGRQLKKLAPGTVQQALKKVSPTVASKIASGLKEYGILVGTETLTEGLQQGVSEGAVATGMAITGRQDEAAEYASGIPGAIGQEMLDVFPSMTLLPLPGSVATTAKNVMTRQQPAPDVPEPPAAEPEQPAPDVPAPTDEVVTSGINDIEAEVLFGEPTPAQEVEEPVAVEEVAPTPAPEPVAVEEPVVQESLTTEQPVAPANEYAGTHRPPDVDNGAPLHDLTGGGRIYPDDVYSSDGLRLYGTGDKKSDSESFKVIQKAKNNPDAEVTIYRAVPKDESVTGINSGDWVTLSKSYAKQHGESTLGGEYQILSQKAKAGELFTNGDSINEFGYYPAQQPQTSPGITDALSRASALLDRAQTEPQGVDVTTDDILAGKTVESLTEAQGVPESVTEPPATMVPEKKMTKARQNSLKQTYMAIATLKRIAEGTERKRNSDKSKRDADRAWSTINTHIPKLGLKDIKKRGTYFNIDDDMEIVSQIEKQIPTWESFQNVQNVPETAVSEAAAVPEAAQGEVSPDAGMQLQSVPNEAQPRTETETTGQSDTDGTGVTADDYEREMKEELAKRRNNREPWQLTREENYTYNILPKLGYAGTSSQRRNIKKKKEAGRKKHRQAVESALSEGKPVPDAVLADYPDLRDRVKLPTVDPVAEQPNESWTIKYDKGTPIGATHDSGVTINKQVTRETKTSRGLSKGGTEFVVTVGDTTFTGNTLESAQKWADEQISKQPKPVSTAKGPVMYGGKTGTDFVKYIWDEGKLGYRAGIALKEWGTKSGKMSKLAEKIAESKWDDLSSAAQRVITNRIKRDYPSVEVESQAQTPVQQPTRKPSNVFDKQQEDYGTYVKSLPKPKGVKGKIKQVAANGTVWNVDGTVYGNWGIHKDGKEFRVTHIPTSLSIKGFKQKSDALQYVAALEDSGIDYSGSSLTDDQKSAAQEIYFALKYGRGAPKHFQQRQKPPSPADVFNIRRDTAKRLSSEPATAEDIQEFMDTAGMGYTVEYLLDTNPPGVPDADTGRRMYAYAGIPLQDGDVIQAKTNRDTKTVTFWKGATMQDVAHEILHVNITSVTPAEAEALAARYGTDWERKEELIARDAADYYLVMREQGVLRQYYERIRDALRNLMRAMGLSRQPVSVEEFFRSVYTGRRARRMRYVGGERFATAHHGTPHTFAPEPGFPHGRFRLDKMGTGEGAQAFGWGIYFADAIKTATTYLRSGRDIGFSNWDSPVILADKAFAQANGDKDVAIEILKRESQATKGDVKKRNLLFAQDIINKGNTTSSLYTLDIPDDAIPKMLLWDAPLSEQSDWVKEKLLPIMNWFKDDEYHRTALQNKKQYASDMEARLNALENMTDQEYLETSDITGEELYRLMADVFRKPDKNTSEYLNSLGIPGLRFLDGNSRGRGEGTYNTVVWDQKLLDRIALLERNGTRLEQMQPMRSGAEIDKEYFDAIDARDWGRVWQIIKNLAKQKGWEYAAHHGSPQRGFTKFNTWGGAIFLSTDYETSRVYENIRGTNLTAPGSETRDFYVDLGANPLVIDAQGHKWSNVPFEGRTAITDMIVSEAQRRGHTGVHFKNIIDGGNNLSDVFAVFDSAQVKLADVITRDDQGRIIPPSERFNVASADVRYTANPDIRYAVKPRPVPKAPEQVERRMKARNDQDRDTVWKRIDAAGGVVKWMWRGMTDTDWFINESGEAGKLMFRLFDTRMNEARTRSAEMVVSLIRNLTTDQYNLASRYLSHADALESVMRAEQYTDPVEFNQNMERFIFGWEETVPPMPVNATYEQFRAWRTSVIDQMKVYMGQLEAEIAEQPAVQDMLQKRREIVSDTQRRIVDRKLLPQNMLNKRNEYFHREIHMAGAIMEKRFGGVSQYSKQIRSFMKKRGTGVNALSAEFDPSSDYLLSELAWLTDANMEIAKVDWWNEMDKAFGVPISQLKADCREQNYTAYVGGKENRARLRQIQEELNEIYDSFIDPVTGKRVEKPEEWAAVRIQQLHDEASNIDGTWRSRKYMGYMLNKIKQEYTFEYDPFSDADSDTNIINELADILDDPAAPGLMKWYVAEIFKTMADVRGKIKTTLQNDPTKQYLTWQDNLPEGYDLVQPDEGHVMYPVMSVTAKALEHFAKAVQKVAHHAGATGIPLDDLELSIPKGNTVYVPGGPKPQIVVPMDIADKINNGMKPKKEKNWIASAFGNVTSKFQRWVLFNWATYPVYAIKNTVSDVENFVNGMALSPKQATEFAGDMFRATQELCRYVYGKDFENISPELRAFRSSGGLGSNEMTSELLSVYDPTDTTAINKATNVLDYVFGYKVTQQANAFRENLLRYAWYLNAKRNLETTGTMPHWGGSRSEDILQVMDKLGVHEAAALWANNQMLNYGNLTLFGQWLRDSKMGIFYSFTELSVRSVAQNIRSNFEYGQYVQNNIATTVRENPFLNVPVVRQLGLGASYAARAAATSLMLAKMGTVWGACALWNSVFFGDDEDELPDEYKFMPHLCVGRNADGTVRVLTNISMLGSVLEFAGVYEAAKMLTDTGLEKTDLGKMAKNMVMGGSVQRMVGHVNPYFKTGLELITGQSYFPDITQPRPKDRFDLLTGMFGLEDVGLALKGAMLADGTRPRVHPAQRLMRVKQVDPMDEKRYEIYALYDAYRAHVGKPDESNNFRGADRYLKNLRHAAKQNDPVAFRENVHSLWINRGQNQKKVTESINYSLRYLDPMERVDKDDRKPFMEFLTPRQREAYQEASAYGKELRKKILQMYQMYGVMGEKK